MSDVARRLALICTMLAALAVSACASRPETGFLAAVGEAAPGATEHTILVATTRQRDERPGTLFNGERAKPLDFATVRLSVPPTHKPGEIEWASTAPGNPQTDFVVRQAGYLDGDKAFLKALNAQLAQRPRGSRKVLLFIHGYNTMFAESLYRFGQVVHDSKAPAVPVLFTWASRGAVTQYVYDTNSATAARDDLERTIRLLFDSNAEQVNILAHSMGNWVTVETLRQIKISGKTPPMGKLGAIVLAAPDIDIDVFKSQMRRFGKPKRPFFVVLSKDDKALAASRFIAGGQARLGADGNTAELAELGAVVVDMTDVKATDASNHGKFAQLAEIAPQLRTVLEQGVHRPPSAGSATHDAVNGSLEAIVALPVAILGLPLKIIAR
jgi:esterase/lipase superfamily enzyme